MAADIPDGDFPTYAASVVSIPTPYAPSVEHTPPPTAPSVASVAESEMSLGIGSRYSGPSVDLLDLFSEVAPVAEARSRSASPTPSHASTLYEWATYSGTTPFDLLGYDPREHSTRWSRRRQARSTPVVAEEMVL